ncbi:hypothetical protein [Aestuariivirga sp.]|uniref:hypothetical protein n=1 Tax=Aestuariivirga sp. TaxID=2650926 RepID=UPI0035B0C80C
MSRKHNKTGRSKGESRHVRLYHWMIKSPAWEHSSTLGRAIYIELAGRYAGEGSNNGRIAYSVREVADTFKVSPATASRAFRELEEKGFISCITKGGFSRKVRHATEWRLTEFRCDVTGEMASKDFMRWVPSVPVVKQKMQNTVPVVKQAVPVVKQYGASGETIEGKRGPDGASGETINPDFGPSTVSPQAHIYVYQGTSAPEGGPSHNTLKRGRSAPPKSAVASPRVPETETPKVTASPLQGESRTARNHTGSTASHLMNTALMKRAMAKGGVQ